MFELCARLVLAGVLTFVAGAVPLLDFQLSIKVAIAVAVVGAFGYQLERRGLRKPSVSGLIAVADAFAIATLVGHHKVLGSLGFLVLAPIGYAALAHGARALSVSAVAAGALLLAQVVNGGTITAEVMGQVLGVLLVGMVTGRRREVIREVETQGTPDALEELWERYGKLREAYRELETTSRRDHATSVLATAIAGNPDGWARRMAVAIADLTGAGRVVLYVKAEFGPSMVVRGVEGEEGTEQAIEVDLRLPTAHVRLHAERMIAEHRLESAAPFETVLLNRAGQIVGMVQIEHPTREGLLLCSEVLNEVAGVVAEMVVDGHQREEAERRRREAELLYDMAALASGAESAAHASARFCRELGEAMGADHVGVYMIELDGPRALARHGSDVRLLESLSFSEGPGLPGWIRIDAPELLMFDVRSDSRCPADAALKARVGSYMVMPLEVGAGTFGYITAASYRTGGLDLGAAETLRIAAAELGHALSRLNETNVPEGLMNPREFHLHVGSRRGSLVVLDPLRMERLIETFGRPAVNHALRRFARRVASRLPQGGAVCRRADGDYLAFLPECDEAFASMWANELAATASMIGLRTPDGSNRIPLAIRARVAMLDPQSHEIFQGLSA
jgi:GGDEF domain-containing protein